MSGHKRLSSDKTHLRHGVSHDNNESFHYVSAVSPSAPLPLPTVRGDDWCPKGSNSAHQGSKRTASLVSLRARDQKSQSQPCARRILISAGISESISGAANTFNSSLPSSCDQECLPESRPDERPGIWNAHPGNPWDSMSSASSFSSSPLDDWQHASDHINQSACSSSHTLFTLPTVSAGSNSASSRKSDSDSRPSFDLPGDTVTMAPLETIVAVDKSPPVTHSLKYNKVSSTGAKWIGRKNGPDGHSPDRPALQVSLGGDTKHREVRLSQEKVSYTSGDCKVKAEAVWGLAPSNNHLMVHVGSLPDTIPQVTCIFNSHTTSSYPITHPFFPSLAHRQICRLVESPPPNQPSPLLPRINLPVSLLRSLITRPQSRLPLYHPSNV